MNNCEDELDQNGLRQEYQDREQAIAELQTLSEDSNNVETQALLREKRALQQMTRKDLAELDEST